MSLVSVDALGISTLCGLASVTEAVRRGFFLVLALPGERCSSVLRLASMDESESESESIPFSATSSQEILFAKSG